MTPGVFRRNAGQAAAMVPAFLMLAVASILLGFYISTAPAPYVPLLAVAGLFVFVLAFFRMDLALFLLIAAMLFSPEISVASLPRRDVVIRIEDVMIVVLGLAWLARVAVWRGASLVPRTPINGLIGFYCVSFIISTLAAIIVSGIGPVKAAFYILKYVEYFILFFLAAGTLRNTRMLKAYLTALLLTFLCVSVYAAAQIGHVPRVSAPFEGERGEPNTLGGYLLLMISVSLGLFCHARNRRESLWYLFLAFAALAPFLHTLSRASYLAFGPACLMLLVYNRSSRRNLLGGVLLGGALLGLLFMPGSVRDRIAYTFKPQYQENIPVARVFGVAVDPSSSARLRDAERAVNYWKKAPLFGYGLTGVAFQDSQYVSNLVELGAVGFIAFALLIGFLHREVLRVYRRSDDPVVRGLALGFAAGNVGLLVHALTANTFILIRIMEPYWFIAALILVSVRLDPGRAAVPAGDGRRNIDMVLSAGGRAAPVDAT